MGRAQDKLVQAARRRKAEKRARQRVRRQRVIERRSAGISRAAAVSNWKDAEAEVEKVTTRLKALAGEKGDVENRLIVREGDLKAEIRFLRSHRMYLSIAVAVQTAALILLALR